ncbi:MAG TPA: patatin-like phospholipase family protein [Candidatus Binatia bacterium]|nr:patatin-like phospholipase family protein [Candidatus Binatia bacterium]
MGITIVQKSELGVRKHDPKIALVLAGGAVTGGAFKLGGLKALDDFLVNRKVNEFETYIGLSAGAVLAAPLAAGVSPAEMLKSLEGKSEEFSQFQPLDFYNPNFAEFVSRPLQFAFDLAAYAPRVLLDLTRHAPTLLGKLRAALSDYLRKPSLGGLQVLLEPIAETIDKRRRVPFVLDYLPSGFFDNASIERYLRRNFEHGGISNDFRTLYQHTKRELYIGAMNLDTAERVVFGHDEDASVTVSEAVQASTALPGFYKPAHLHGVDYVDGGVRRTANIDVAIEHGADLVICYNPFRPFSNRVRRKYVKELGKVVVEGRPLVDTGLLTVINQVFRTLLHSRLQYGLRQYQDDPHFTGDIIVIEPKETDLHFFQMSALAYWQRIVAAQHGYISVTESIEQNYDLIKPILERYGIAITRKAVRASVDKLRAENEEEVSEVLTRDVPRRNLSVA